MRSILPVFVAAFAAVVFTADAMAMYHPGMGRFMQRDPNGTATSPNRVGRGVLTNGRGFISRNSQYQDGMSLYQYVRSGPTRYVDYNGEEAVDILHGAGDLIAGSIGGLLNLPGTLAGGGQTLSEGDLPQDFKDFRDRNNEDECCKCEAWVTAELVERGPGGFWHLAIEARVPDDNGECQHWAVEMREPADYGGTPLGQGNVRGVGGSSGGEFGVHVVNVTDSVGSSTPQPPSNRGNLRYVGRVGFTGDDCDGVRSLGRSASDIAQQVEANNTSYLLFSRNSNSFVGSVLRGAGGTIGGLNTVTRAPGFQNNWPR